MKRRVPGEFVGFREGPFFLELGQAEVSNPDVAQSVQQQVRKA